MSILFKNTSLPIHDVDTSKGIITLYASAFGNVDSDNDVIEKGAFTKTISETGPKGANRIKHLWMHNPYEPIGVPVVMGEDAKGLLVQSKVSEVKNGDYLKLYADGVITEHSIGFDIVKGLPTKDHNIIKEVKLWEYSSVTWGANPLTLVVGMKGANKQDMLKTLTERLDRLSKAMTKGTYTDDTFNLLAVEVALIKDALCSLVQEEPAAATPHLEEPNEFKMEFDVYELWTKSQS